MLTYTSVGERFRGAGATRVPDDPAAMDDESLVIRMMDGDEEALREFLRDNLQPVRDVLRSTYGSTVQSNEIDEAINLAALKLWESASDYDTSKGTLRAWFYAQSAVIDILRREKRYRTRNRPYGPEHEGRDNPPHSADDEPLTKDEQRRARDLDYVIEKKLVGLQQAIIKADLAAGGLADAGRLAEIYETTKESIYVSRHKAHKKIESEMLMREKRGESLRGKQ